MFGPVGIYISSGERGKRAAWSYHSFIPSLTQGMHTPSTMMWYSITVMLILVLTCGIVMAETNAATATLDNVTPATSGIVCDCYCCFGDNCNANTKGNYQGYAPASYCSQCSNLVTCQYAFFNLCPTNAQLNQTQGNIYSVCANDAHNVKSPAIVPLIFVGALACIAFLCL